jgi:hypothetical protein
VGPGFNVRSAIPKRNCQTPRQRSCCHARHQNAACHLSCSDRRCDNWMVLAHRLGRNSRHSIGSVICRRLVLLRSRGVRKWFARRLSFQASVRTYWMRVGPRARVIVRTASSSTHHRARQLATVPIRLGKLGQRCEDYGRELLSCFRNSVVGQSFGINSPRAQQKQQPASRYCHCFVAGALQRPAIVLARYRRLYPRL